MAYVYINEKMEAPELDEDGEEERPLLFCQEACIYRIKIDKQYHAAKKKFQQKEEGCKQNIFDIIVKWMIVVGRVSFLFVRIVLMMVQT